MMGLNHYDRIKIDHDCKRIAKGFKLARDEKNDEKRKYIMDLLLDEFDRLQQDIQEMTDKESGEE